MLLAVLVGLVVGFIQEYRWRSYVRTIVPRPRCREQAGHFAGGSRECGLFAYHEGPHEMLRYYEDGL